MVASELTDKQRINDTAKYCAIVRSSVMIQACFSRVSIFIYDRI